MLNTAQRRQEVHDKIKASGSKYKYIYSEMKRLGFWKEGEVDFKSVEAYFEKEREVLSELQALLVEKKKIENPDALLKKIHEKRKAESKQRQKENKEKREAERKAKAEKWELSKQEEIIYLGEGYSSNLNHTESEPEKLHTQQLPELDEARDLAQQMGISVGELRFLAFNRKNSKISHYQKFVIPKRSGGERVISAPMPKLKKAQHWILENILNKVAVHEAAQGCVKNRSIKSNAAKHLKKDLLVNQDLENFFPTITYARIKGMFRGMGYSHNVASILALLCSEPETKQVNVYGETYHAQRTDRFLPQGSPCSPAITNIMCRKLDARLHGLGQKFGYSYTRYVDDISFSANGDAVNDLNKILLYSKKIITDEGFKLNDKKLRIMRKGVSQHVTGLLVNEKPNVNKKTFKRFRALIFQIEKDGLEGKTWNGKTGEALLASLHGFASFVNQINPELGQSYLLRTKAILLKYNYKPKNPYKKEEPKAASSSKLGFSLKGLFKKIFGR